MKNTARLTRRRFVGTTVVAAGGLLAGCTTTSKNLHTPGRQVNAYLQITLKIQDTNRAAAAAVYRKYKQPFLDSIRGAQSKELLIRAEDVQVLHGFSSETEAAAYLESKLFQEDVVGELASLLQAEPEVRIYASA